MFKTGFVVFFFQWINILINMSTYTPPQCFLKRDDCLHVFKCKCTLPFSPKWGQKHWWGQCWCQTCLFRLRLWCCTSSQRWAPHPCPLPIFVPPLNPRALTLGCSSGTALKKKKKEPRDVTFLFLCPLGGAKLLLLLPVDFHYFRCSQI